MATKKKTTRKKAAKKKTNKPAQAPAPTEATSAKPGHFANSIVGYELVDPATIRRNPLNFRNHPTGQRAAMRDALNRVGFTQAVVVNKRNRHLIDGEMRLDLAEENTESLVPVLWVDLNEEQENLALMTTNPLGELAVIDPEQLNRLLSAQTIELGGLGELVAALEEVAEQATIKPVGKRDRPNLQRADTVQHSVKAVIAVTDVGTVERAIAMAGKPGRGDALVEICKHFIESRTHGGIQQQTRQHDDQPEDSVARQLAEAAAAGAADT